jgi:hypothetical protein
MYGRPKLKRTQINYRDCIAFTISDVSVLTRSRPKIAQIARAKVQPAQAADDRQQNDNE